MTLFYLGFSSRLYWERKAGLARRAGGVRRTEGTRSPFRAQQLAASAPTPAKTDTARPRGSARRGLWSQPPGSPRACTLGAKGMACVPTMAKLLNISAPGLRICCRAGSPPAAPRGPAGSSLALPCPPGQGRPSWVQASPRGHENLVRAEAPVVLTPQPGGHRCHRGRGWGAVAQQRLPWPGLSGVPRWWETPCASWGGGQAFCWGPPAPGVSNPWRQRGLMGQLGSRGTCPLLVPSHRQRLWGSTPPPPQPRPWPLDGTWSARVFGFSSLCQALRSDPAGTLWPWILGSFSCYQLDSPAARMCPGVAKPVSPAHAGGPKSTGNSS